MEENKNQAPSAGQSKNGNRRRRPHHRGGQKPQGALQNAEQHEANAQKAGQPQNQHHSRNNHRGGRHHGGHRPEERRPNTGAEPVADEQYLKDLRAKIVVQPSSEEPPAPEVIEPVPFDEPNETPIPTDTAATLLDEIERREAAEQSKEPVETVEVIGVRFRSVGKTYYFDPANKSLKCGDFVIVETSRGPEFGEVMIANTKVPQKSVVSPLRPLVRVATEADVAHNEENRQKEQSALEICREKIAAHGLEMKLIDVQYAFDNSKLLFYFSSDGRVDFRELVKDLAGTFRTRIELRQIGIRDEAKLLGGIGACGRLLCCSTFLPDFAQVSIKMAKEQNLSLSSTKISGVCGRLMCCLRYESDTYAEEIRRTPPIDAVVKTPDGVGRVVSTSPLAGTVKVILNDAEGAVPKEYHRDDLTVLSTDKKRGAPKDSGDGDEK